MIGSHKHEHCVWLFSQLYQSWPLQKTPIESFQNIPIESFQNIPIESFHSAAKYWVVLKLQQEIHGKERKYYKWEKNYTYPSLYKHGKMSMHSILLQA